MSTILELFKQKCKELHSNKQSIDFHEVSEEHKESLLRNWFRLEFTYNNEIIYYTVQSGDKFIYFNYYPTSIKQELVRLQELYNYYIEKSKDNSIGYKQRDFKKIADIYHESIQNLKDEITL